VNGGANKPCTNLLGFEDIKPNSVDYDDNPINVRYYFKKQIKAI